MTWIVDTCVLLDIHLHDPVFGRPSAECLAHLASAGLAITSTTVIELAPAFAGDLLLLEDFLAHVGVAHHGLTAPTKDHAMAWNDADTKRAFAAWHQHIHARRSNDAVPRRPVADLLIATVASRGSGVITRNPTHFRAFYPASALPIVNPTKRASWP